MSRYCYLCPECGERKEVIRSICDHPSDMVCGECDSIMDHDFKAENVLVGAGRRSYSKPIVSDSLAILPEQIPEHRKMFPNIEVTKEGQPVFDNFSDHEAYLKKCNFEKVPQKKRKKVKIF
ncbi:hypothetical protein LCGC14_0355610 [marine sediment metagenome]|uniref:Uncharacterized protein n=1 Tax=marine sediment metagenome TaxID=412755 RepID=A0A0F9TEZ8_9ZZZZ